MKLYRTCSANRIVLSLWLVFSLPTLCTDFFDQLTPHSFFTQAVELCMRILTDSTKQFDESTHIDLCIGRLIRLNNLIDALSNDEFNSHQLSRHDRTYLIALTNIVKTKQQVVFTIDSQALFLIQSAQARLYRLLEQA